MNKKENSPLSLPVLVEIRAFPHGCQLKRDQVETWHSTFDEACYFANEQLRKEWNNPYANC